MNKTIMATDDKDAATNTLPSDTEAFIDANAAVLGLTIAPEWKANVAMFVDVARGMALRIEATGAATASEAAPVFTPRALTPHTPQ